MTAMDKDDLTAVLVYNEPSEFVDRLILEIQTGKGLVPFVGSGCSAPSGIIMGQDFTSYLAFSVFLCVASKEEIEKVGTYARRWDLRRNGWPPFPKPAQLETAKKWIQAGFKKVCDDGGVSTETKLDPENFPDEVARVLMSPLRPSVLNQERGPKQDFLRRLLPLLASENLLRGGYNISGYSPTSEDAIVERAIRSLHDWRATLGFLSELRLVQGERLILDAPDPAVVNSFNVYITQGKKPNLTHNMLCHLAGPARFRVILTTNFDTLIEEAFRQLDEHIESISVSVKGDLPDPDLVHARNTVVKMHGTIWETRADFSLDETPTRESKQRFFHYVHGHYPGADLSSSGRTFMSSHLLVCGYSGSDRRCMEMMKYLLDADDSGCCIFWICNSERSLESLRRNFPEKYRKRVIAVATARTDLLLYELYQHLQLSLPKGGFSYQYTANVPPSIPRGLPVGRTLEDHATSKDCDNRPATACGRLVKWFTDEKDKNLKIIDGEPGVLATLRNTVDYLVEKKLGTPIWLELEDYPDSFCLAHELLLIISIRLGLFQLGHADIVPASLIEQCEDALGKNEASELRKIWGRHLELIVNHHFLITAEKWLIILYSRNGAGGCAGWQVSDFWNENEFGNKERCGRFFPFLQALCDVNFKVIYSPYSQKRHDRDAGSGGRIGKWAKVGKFVENKLEENFVRGDDSSIAHPLLKKWKDVAEYRWPTVHDVRVNDPELSKEILQADPADNSNVNFESSMGNLCEQYICNLKAPGDYLGRLRFLYASTLFRQSRHYSAFLSEGIIRCPKRFNIIGFDNDWARSETLKTYLSDEAIDRNIYYQKPGGFAWAYRDYRHGIRMMIEILPSEWFRECKIHLGKTVEPFHTWRSHHHYWIADWYLRAFYTTGNATPLMEAVYHLFQTIVNIGSFRSAADFPEKHEIAFRQYRRWRGAVCDLIKALRIGGSKIRFWFGPAQFRAWFSETAIKDITTTCELSPEILAGLKFSSDQQREAAREHAESLVKQLEGELRQLGEHAGEGTRVKQYASFSRMGIQEVGSARPAPTDNLDLDDCVCWGESQGLTRDLCSLIFPTAKNLPWPVKELSAEVTILQRAELKKYIGDDHYFYLIQELNEWAFIFLKRAKLRQLSIGRMSDTQPKFFALDKTALSLWQAVCVLSSTALEFCRITSPFLEDFDYSERIRALSIYAVALGRLGRFFEAQRRLNEASALLSKLKTDQRQPLLGIVELRRAELHLLEAVFMDPFTKNNTEKIFESIGFSENNLAKRFESYDARLQKYRNGKKFRDFVPDVQMAKLDDAWCSLEAAERLFAGALHSPRWWGRLCCLKLRCLLEYYERSAPEYASGYGRFARVQPLAQRNPSDPFLQIYELFCKGLASCEGHETLRLRLADFATAAGYSLLNRDLVIPNTWSRMITVSRRIVQAPCRRSMQGIKYARRIGDLLDKYELETKDRGNWVDS